MMLPMIALSSPPLEPGGSVISVKTERFSAAEALARTASTRIEARNSSPITVATTHSASDQQVGPRAAPAEPARDRLDP